MGEKALVNNAGAILGEISVDNAAITTPEKDAAAEKGVQGTGSSFKKWIPQIVVVALLAFACGHALWGFYARWHTKARQCAPMGPRESRQAAAHLTFPQMCRGSRTALFL